MSKFKLFLIRCFFDDYVLVPKDFLHDEILEIERVVDENNKKFNLNYGIGSMAISHKYEFIKKLLGQHN